MSGAKILSMRRDADRQAPLPATTLGCSGWRTVPQNIFFGGCRVARDREQLAQHWTGAGAARGFRNNIRAGENFNTDMALQYVFNDDEDLTLEYEDRVETVVALREEIQDKDLSTNILEATSATMRSLLTAFGK